MQFQLVQVREDRVVLWAEALSPPSAEDLGRLRASIQPLLGPGVDFAVEVVPEIVPTPGGKFWVRRSLINSLYEDGGLG